MRCRLFRKINIGWANIFILLLAGLYLAGCGGDQPAPQRSTPPPPTSSESSPVQKTTGTASISGTVSFIGDVPKLKTIDMSSIAGCKEQHNTEPKSESLVLGDGNTIANVIVKIKSGLPPNAKYAPPTNSAELDQIGCTYIPHVLVAQVGQTVKFKNSDTALHNVHTLSEKNPAFNKAVNKGGEIARTYDQEEIFLVKCDIHPWMENYVSVVSHPFFSITKSDGKFEIKNLPAGKYTVEVWHERLGEKTQEVEVSDGQSAGRDFTLSKS
jgi:plastocyanin